MTKLAVGRFGGELVSGEVTTVEVAGGKVSIKGETSRADLERSLALRQQLLGYVDSPDESFVPVLWSEDPSVAGFYRVTAASMSGEAGSAPKGFLSYSVDLERVPGYASPLLENVVVAKTRTNVLSLIAAGVIGVPASVHSFVLMASNPLYGEATFTSSVLMVRQGEHAAINVQRADYSSDGVRFCQYYLDPETFYDGAATLRVGTPPRVAVGRQIRNTTTAWELSNDLFELRAASESKFEMEFHAWDPSKSAWTPWEKIGFWGGISSNVSYPLAPLVAPHTIRVLRNTPEQVTIRLLSQDPLTLVAITYDITLRRGARYVAVELQSVSEADFTVRVGNFVDKTTTAITRSSKNVGYYVADDTGVTFFGAPTEIGTWRAPGESAQNQIRSSVDAVMFVNRWSFCFGKTLAGSDTAEQSLREYWWAISERQTVVAQ